MSSTVCQEPTLIEPRVFDVNSVPPKPDSFLFSATTTAAQNADIGGWAFLQSLTKSKDTNVYVHPSEKRSVSVLSERSLEMCTESLGSETGSDISDEMSMLSMETANNFNPPKPRKISNVSKRVMRTNSFPPPLSSISSFNGVEMRSYREDGRLVLEAFPTHSPYTYFQAERAEGRLRLSLLKECSIIDEEAIEAEEEETEEEEEEDADTEEGNCGNCGVEEISRRNRSRCTEGGRGQTSILNWEPFWVAT